MLNLSEQVFPIDDNSDGVIINEPGQTVINDETTTSATDLSMPEVSDIITETRPEYREIVAEWKVNNPDATSADLLDFLNGLDTDNNPDPNPVNLTNTYIYTLFFDQLRDVAFNATGDTRIILQMNGETILDNLYTPSFDGMIHLDLQDIVRENTVNYLSSICPVADLIMEPSGFLQQCFASSRLYVRVTDAVDDNEYYFTVCSFESGASERRTDIDFLRIPKNYLLPLSIQLTPEEQKYISLQMYLESGQRRQLLSSHPTPFIATVDYTPGDSLLFSRDYPMASIPARAGEQFRLIWIADGSHQDETSQEVQSFHKVAASPFLKICPGDFHQYIFLNKYGQYDNIPMSGSKIYAPEYDIENADRTYSIDKVKSTKREVYTQNTGPQTRATLDALAELLLSPEIFHYIPGISMRRIVVENPTITINSKNSINSATFSWRYAGK